MSSQEMIEYIPGTSTALVRPADHQDEVQSVLKLMWVHLFGFTMFMTMGNVVVWFVFVEFTNHFFACSDACRFGFIAFLSVAGILELACVGCGFYAAVIMLIKSIRFVKAHGSFKGVLAVRVLCFVQLISLVLFVILTILFFVLDGRTIPIMVRVFVLVFLLAMHIVPFYIGHAFILNFHLQRRYLPSSSDFESTLLLRDSDPEVVEQLEETV